MYVRLKKNKRVILHKIKNTHIIYVLYNRVLYKILFLYILNAEVFLAFYRDPLIIGKYSKKSFHLFLFQNEEMARPAVARARRPVDRTPPPWRRRGWVDPAAAWIPDRAARVRIGARPIGVAAVSCIAAAATVPAWSDSGYRLTATPCDPARR